MERQRGRRERGGCMDLVEGEWKENKGELKEDKKKAHLFIYFTCQNSFKRIKTKKLKTNIFLAEIGKILGKCT